MTILPEYNPSRIRNSILGAFLFLGLSIFFLFFSIPCTLAESELHLSNFVGSANISGNFQFPQQSIWGNDFWLVWQDNSTGNDEIYLKKSLDGGIAFGNATNLSDNVGSSQFPQIQVLGNTTFVVWQDNSTGNDEIYLKKSTNAGSTFSSKKNLSDNVGSSQFPQIQVLGNTTFVVWQDNSTGNDEIYLKKSTNASTNFYDPRHPPGISTQYLGGPVTTDPSLRVELVARGIQFPTHMAFLPNGDILVLEKNDGTVKKVVNGSIQNMSLLDASVANGVERGMLGIAINDSKHGLINVYLYFTESVKDGDDVLEDKQPLGNRLYRYDLVGDKLVNPKLLLDLPSNPDSAHNGGEILVTSEGHVYLTIGELNRSNANGSNSTITKAQNHAEGLEADGRAGILRITSEGKSVGKGIIGNHHPLDKYFAYGIRNSFGMAFDPINGNLWDVENGPEFGDEINVVEPGFNSGWNKIQGIWAPDGNAPGNITADFKGLFGFNNTGKYMEPALSWYQPSPGLTSMIFLNSSKLGSAYKNNLLVSDFHNGNIYNFELNSSRTGLILEADLADKVVDKTNETNDAIFAHGFGGITDMALGPDGYLYVLSIFQSGDNCDPLRHPGDPCIAYDKSVGGTIFRVVPRSNID
jgi:glucose/arabinose dehydrogenase